jgi:membrane protein implicated in regulation of membrane protease activity
MRSGTRLLVIFTFAIALVVGAVISLALGSWWILGAAVAVHAIATALVLGVVARRLQEADKPDPITEARIEEAEAEREPEGPRIRTDPIHLR